MEVQVHELDVGRRNAERFALDIPAELVFSQRAFRVSVRNISNSGACVYLLTGAIQEVSAELRCSEFSARANVVWSRVPHLGLRFETFFPGETLARLRALSCTSPWKNAPEHMRLAAERVLQDIRAI